MIKGREDFLKKRLKQLSPSYLRGSAVEFLSTPSLKVVWLLLQVWSRLMKNMVGGWLGQLYSKSNPRDFKRDKLTVVFGSFMLWALTNFLPHTWKNCQIFIIMEVVSQERRRTQLSSSKLFPHLSKVFDRWGATILLDPIWQKVKLTAIS